MIGRNLVIHQIDLEWTVQRNRYTAIVISAFKGEVNIEVDPPGGSACQGTEEYDSTKLGVFTPERLYKTPDFTTCIPCPLFYQFRPRFRHRGAVFLYFPYKLGVDHCCKYSISPPRCQSL